MSILNTKSKIGAAHFSENQIVKEAISFSPESERSKMS